MVLSCLMVLQSRMRWSNWWIQRRGEGRPHYKTLMDLSFSISWGFQKILQGLVPLPYVWNPGSTTKVHSHQGKSENFLWCLSFILRSFCLFFDIFALSLPLLLGVNRPLDRIVSLETIPLTSGIETEIRTHQITSKTSSRTCQKNLW